MSTSATEPTASDESTPKELVIALPTISTQTLLVGSLCAAAFLIAVLVLALRRRTSGRRSEILLVGPCDAGKTAILTTLVYDQTLPTHTSLQANSSLIVTPETKRQHRIVDIPGHPRIRDQFKEHLPSAKAVLFVVDASTVTRNGQAVAEHLHHVLHALTSLPPTATLPPLFILAHKSDFLSLPTSTTTSTTTPSQARAQLAIARVRTVLERELEKRRVAQLGGVGIDGLGVSASEEGAGASVEMGGLDCRSSSGESVFRFAEWEAGEVGFLGTWVRVNSGRGAGSEKGEKEDGEEDDTDGLDELREWLEELA